MTVAIPTSPARPLRSAPGPLRRLATLVALAGLAALAGCSEGDGSAEARADDGTSSAVAATSGDVQATARPDDAHRVRTPVPTDRPRGRKAPDFDLLQLDGQPIRLADYAGKVVLLDFWATWCGPCRMSIPHLIDLQEELGEERFQVVGISLDRAPAATVQAFAEKMGITYPIAMGDAAVQRAYGGIHSIPTAFIVDQDGHIVKMIQGFHTKAQLKRVIAPVLDRS